MTDPKLADEANLAAMAFVRRAIEYSQATEAAGSVMADLQPYLEKAAPMLEGDLETGVDVAPALFALIACLAQLGGVCYQHLMQEREGRRLSVPELLGSWDEFETMFVLDPEAKL